jgi:tetratricopeptide (TPR) repeat protein
VALLGAAVCGVFFAASRPASGQVGEDPEAMLSRAVILHQTGDLEGAAAAYELFLRAVPGASRVRSNLGAVYAGLGRYDEAIEQYRRALTGEEGGETELSIRQNLSLALYKAGRFQEAASEAERLLAGGGASRDTLLLLADIDLRLGEEEKVIALLTPVAADDADDKAVAYLLGTALLAEDEVETAERIIERVLRDDSPEGHALFATLHLKRRDCESALAELEKARAGNPQLRTVNYLSGVCLMQERSDWAGAAAAFRREIAIDPNHFESNLFLGNLLRQEGRHEEALPYLVHASRLRSGDVAVDYSLGAVYLALGRDAEAQPLLEEVAAAVPDHMPTHRWLAVLYTRQGRTEEAARERATAGRLAQEAESQAFQGVKESMSELLEQSSAGDGESASAEPPPP